MPRREVQAGRTLTELGGHPALYSREMPRPFLPWSPTLGPHQVEQCGNWDWAGFGGLGLFGHQLNSGRITEYVITSCTVRPKREEGENRPRSAPGAGGSQKEVLPSLQSPLTVSNDQAEVRGKDSKTTSQCCQGRLSGWGKVWAQTFLSLPFRPTQGSPSPPLLCSAHQPALSAASAGRGGGEGVDRGEASLFTAIAAKGQRGCVTTSKLHDTLGSSQVEKSAHDPSSGIIRPRVFQ